MKISHKNMIGLRKSGYYHIPLLYVAFGSNGFSFCLFGQAITVSF